MTTTQKRAKVGGEIGANGDFYEGGKFINTVSANDKRRASRRMPAKARKVQIDPDTCVVLEPGDTRRPIIGIIGCGACFTDRYDNTLGDRHAGSPIMPYPPAFEEFGDHMYNGTPLAEIVALCDRYNAGERWI